MWFRAITLSVLYACAAPAAPDGTYDPGPPTDVSPIVAPTGEWSWIDFPRTMCQDGSPTGLGLRMADPSKLLIYFEGGGACWSRGTCQIVAWRNGFAESNFVGLQEYFNGVLDAEDENNPFREWSVAYVPYCSGDVFAGNNLEGAEGAVQVGYVNVGEYLHRLVPTFADAERVVLSGVSAGGFGAAWNYDRVQTAFGDVRVDLLDDSGTAFSDRFLHTCLQQQWRDIWNLDATLPPDCDECTQPDGGGLGNLVPFLANRYPDRRLGLLSATEDGVIRVFFGIGQSADCNRFQRMPGEEYREGLLELRDETLAPYDNFKTFFVPGDRHTFLGSALDTETPDGQALPDWIRAFIDLDAPFEHAGP